MSERYITLLGTEQVQSAANQMRSAADDMRCAASNMALTFETHQRFMDDWLRRLADTLERVNSPTR